MVAMSGGASSIYPEFYIPGGSGGQPVDSSTLPAAMHRPATDVERRVGKPSAPSAAVSKRRSRASKKTPTTLVNTDTSNFRAMVQKFTGAPSSCADGGGGFNIQPLAAAGPSLPAASVFGSAGFDTRRFQPAEAAQPLLQQQLQWQLLQGRDDVGGGFYGGDGVIINPAGGFF